MKKTKKIMCLVMAIVICVAMSLSVFASTYALNYRTLATNEYGTLSGRITEGNPITISVSVSRNSLGKLHIIYEGYNNGSYVIGEDLYSSFGATNFSLVYYPDVYGEIDAMYATCEIRGTAENAPSYAVFPSAIIN